MRKKFLIRKKNTNKNLNNKSDSRAGHEFEIGRGKFKGQKIQKRIPFFEFCPY